MERFHHESGKLEFISDSGMDDLCGIIMPIGILRLEFTLKPLMPNFTADLHFFCMLQVLSILQK